MNAFEVVDEERAPGVYVVRLKGEFDFVHAPAARADINNLIESDARRVVVNLDEVEYIDSAGLGVLVGTLARMRERDGELEVVCNAPRIRRVFDITKLRHILTLHETEEEAGLPPAA
jgi:anti-sigma B factor antagonist